MHGLIKLKRAVLQCSSSLQPYIIPRVFMNQKRPWSPIKKPCSYRSPNDKFITYYSRPQLWLPAGHQQATASQSVTNCSQDTKTGFFSSTVHDSSTIQVPMCTWPSSDSVSATVWHPSRATRWGFRTPGNFRTNEQIALDHDLKLGALKYSGIQASCSNYHLKELFLGTHCFLKMSQLSEWKKILHTGMKRRKTNRN